VLGLAACWSPPVATQPPKGPARLIESNIVVRADKDPAVVRSVDAGARRIVIVTADGTAPATYRMGTHVSGLSRVQPGAAVRASVTEALAVYVLSDGRIPSVSGSPGRIVPDARVLSVDPSYRLLQLRYPDGHDETFKVGYDVKLSQMRPGDGVLLRPLEVTELSVRKR
jgi:hypothetical protein